MFSLLKCRFRQERSSRLPVGKKRSFIFCPWKGFRTHVSKIVQLFSNSFFSRRHKPKMIFGQYTRVDSDRKRKFHRFCPARNDCNNIAHAILSSYKLQGAFNQFNEKIWKLQLKYFSYNSSSFDLYLHIKIHQFVRKNSQNEGVNRAKKAYQCVVYTPMRSPIASNPRVYLQLLSTNILKTTQIHVFAQLRSCEKMNDFWLVHPCGQRSS